MAILAKRANAFGQTKPRGRTNLRLWETITGSVPLFPDCYLQWMAQLQRVEATQPGPPELRPPCCFLAVLRTLTWRMPGLTYCGSF